MTSQNIVRIEVDRAGRIISSPYIKTEETTYLKCNNRCDIVNIVTKSGDIITNEFSKYGRLVKQTITNLNGTVQILDYGDERRWLM